MKSESNKQNNASFQTTYRDELTQEKWKSNFLHWKLINISTGTCILSVCYPTGTEHVIWLDAWSITALSKLFKMVIMHTFTQLWCME